MLSGVLLTIPITYIVFKETGSSKPAVMNEKKTTNKNSILSHINYMCEVTSRINGFCINKLFFSSWFAFLFHVLQTNNLQSISPTKNAFQLYNNNNNNDTFDEN